MSISVFNFESDVIGSFPTGFSSWTVPIPWTVIDFSGDKVLTNNSVSDAVILCSDMKLYNNCVFRMRFNETATTDRWWVFLRRTEAGDNGILIGVIDNDKYMSAYEIISGSSVRKIYQQWNNDFRVGFHNIEIALRDKSIVMYCSGSPNAITINYDQLVGNEGFFPPLIGVAQGNVRFDNISYVIHNFPGFVKDDLFDNGIIGEEWRADVSPSTGISWEETTELRLSGVSDVNNFPSVSSNFVATSRTGLYQEIKFKNVSGWSSSQSILFRIEDTTGNYYDLGVNNVGYYLYKYENNIATSPSSKALFGNESSVFHTLKMLWDEYHKAVWAWVDNTFIARIPFTPEYWANMQKISLYAYSPAGVSIDKRFKDYVLRSANVGRITGPFVVSRPDVLEDAFLS